MQSSRSVWRPHTILSAWPTAARPDCGSYRPGTVRTASPHADWSGSPDVHLGSRYARGRRGCCSPGRQTPITQNQVSKFTDAPERRCRSCFGTGPALQARPIVRTYRRARCACSLWMSADVGPVQERQAQFNAPFLRQKQKPLPNIKPGPATQQR